METNELLFNFIPTKNVLRAIPDYDLGSKAATDFFEKYMNSVESLIGQMVIIEIQSPPALLGRKPFKVNGILKSFKRDEGTCKVYNPDSPFYLADTDRGVFIDDDRKLSKPDDLCHNLHIIQIDRVWKVDQILI